MEYLFRLYWLCKCIWILTCNSLLLLFWLASDILREGCHFSCHIINENNVFLKERMTILLHGSCVYGVTNNCDFLSFLSSTLV